MHITPYPNLKTIIESASCQYGYATEYSPLGKRVCLARLSYDRNIGEPDEASWIPQHIYGSCRYR